MSGGSGQRRAARSGPPAPVPRTPEEERAREEEEERWWRAYGKARPAVVEFGPMRRWGRWWVVTTWCGKVRVRETSFRGRPMSDAREVADGVSYTEAMIGGLTMASKWIAAAVAAAQKHTTVRAVDEPVLFKGRPALKDFMVELEGEKGKPREPSVLMVAVSADGMRVGLKDEAAGGWLWREATTLEGCLDAIEKALQAGNVQWAVPGGRGGRRK